MAISARVVDALHDQLQKTKDDLRGVDENLKKLTGRTPGFNRQPGFRDRQDSTPTDARRGRGTGRLFAAARRGINPDGFSGGGRFSSGGGPYSRPGGGTERRRRDSLEDEDNFNKPSVQSSVSAAESKSRLETMRKQTEDKEGMARNKRMFGFLVGTLSQFKKDTKETTDKAALKRIEIEKKLEQRQQEEKEMARHERRMLYEKRDLKQTKLKRLEHKLELVALHEDWEKRAKLLTGFIRTRNKPYIYYKPKIQTAESRKKLEDSRKLVEEMIMERRSKLEADIEHLMGADDDEEGTNEGKEEADDEMMEVDKPIAGEKKLRRKRKGERNGDQERFEAHKDDDNERSDSSADSSSDSEDAEDIGGSSSSDSEDEHEAVIERNQTLSSRVVVKAEPMDTDDVTSTTAAPEVQAVEGVVDVDAGTAADSMTVKDEESREEDKENREQISSRKRRNSDDKSTSKQPRMDFDEHYDESHEHNRRDQEKVKKDSRESRSHRRHSGDEPKRRSSRKYSDDEHRERDAQKHSEKESTRSSRRKASSSK